MAGFAGDAPRLWAFAARQIWRKARRAFRALPGYRWRYGGRTPERVLIAPPDLRLADPQIASDIYYGRWALAGHLVETGGRSPFQLTVANRHWQSALHGFRWLRHMRAANTELAAANARALVSDWIASHRGRLAGPAWEPGTTAQRLIAWLQHAPVVLQGSELPFYRAFLRSLAMQMRYLRAAARDMEDGEERLRVRASLAFAALSLPVSSASLRQATRRLAQELERQILPDGGHVSRNPQALLELLSDLLPLRQTYASQGEEPPPALVGAIDRMMPALRFFRHQDGTVARFNGMGETAHGRVASILRHDDTAGAPLLNAPHSGYQRLAMGGTIVIADTGPPPPPELAGAAHAGCLAFELSSGRNHFVVNAGAETFGHPDFRPLARATAAHSTATLNDTSSARFTHPARLVRLTGAPLVDGPKVVTSERLDGPGVQGFLASHDGYLRRFGLVHERQLTLSEAGSLVSGADRFFLAGGEPPREGSADAVAVRFHLHPDIELFRDSAGRLVMGARDGAGWTLFCDKVEPAVEESIFFAALGGPRRSRQIVLSFRASEIPELRWQLRRRGAG